MQQQEVDYKRYVSLILRKKRIVLVVALAIMTGVIVATYVLPKKYEAKSTVFIEKSVISEMVKGFAVTPSIEDKIKVVMYALTSRSLIVKVVNELDLPVKRQGEAELEARIKEFQQSLQVKVKDKEGLFTISFTHEDPRVARDFVNTLVRRYIEENLSNKREDSYGASQFLSEQISTFKERVEKADKLAEEYKLKHGLALVTNESQIIASNNEIQQQLNDILAKKASLEGAKNHLVKGGGPLKSQIQALQRRLEELQAQYTDNYPEVVRLRVELDSLREQAGQKGPISPNDSTELEKLNVELASLRMVEGNLRRQLAQNNATLRAIPAARSGLQEIESEKNSQKALYDQMVTRHGQSEVSKQMEVQDKTTTFRIIDPAVMPVRPVSPDRVKMMLMAIIAGIAGGVGIVVGLDSLDKSVKTPDTAKAFGLPIFAVIPAFENPAVVAVEKKKDLRFLLVGGVYLSFLLVIIATEVIGYSLVDKIISKVLGH